MKTIDEQPWLSEVAPLTEDDLRMLGWQDAIKEEILELVITPAKVEVKSC